ncbi:MAG TPA: hypothetical protein DCM05_15015 [Elusimicrobia bacterium]|nr:hypothetical protein [Elusimicrobiota bacterium]
MSAGLTRAALAFALAGLPLAFSARQAAVYALPKLLVLAAAAALAWAGLALARRGPRRTPMDLPLAALALWTAVATALSLDPWMSLLGHYRAYFYGDLSFLLYAALFYAAASADEGDSPQTLLSVGAGAAALCGAYAVLQTFGIELAVGIRELEPGKRAFSTLGSPVYLGSYLQLFVPVALALALDGKGAARPLGGFCLLGLAAGLFLSISRGAWLSAVAGAAAYLLWTRRLPAPRTKKAWAVLGLSCLLAAGGAAALASRLRPTGVSDSARLQLWADAARIAAAHPWAGSGPDTFEAALRRYRSLGMLRALGQQRGQADAHNDLLQAAATLGWPGLAAYLGVLWGLWLAVRRAAPGAGRPWAAAAASALVGLFVQAKLNPTPLAVLGAAAVLAGLLCSMGDGQKAPARAPASAAAAALICVLLLAGAFRLVRADYRQKRAFAMAWAGRWDEAAADFKRAQALNPFCLHYRFAYARQLLSESSREADPARRASLLDEAVSAGREALRRHPNQFDARQMLGAALLASGLSGQTEALTEAEAALASAQELDPFFLPLLENRLAAARARKDAEALRELEARRAWVRQNSGG